MPVFRSPASCVAGLTTRDLNVEQALVMLGMQSRVHTALSAAQVGLLGSSPDGTRLFAFDITNTTGGLYTTSRLDWGFVTGSWTGNLDLYAFAHNNNDMIMVGGVNTTPDTDPIRYSTDNGANWSAATLGGAPIIVYGLTWVQTQSLWIASADSGIWTSSAGVPSFSQVVATPNGARQIVVRERPSFLAVAMRWTGFPGSGTGYQTSPDLTNWTTRTFPADTYTASQGCYSEFHGKFFQPSANGIYSSSDGINWNLDAPGAPNIPVGVVEGLLVRGDGYVSANGSSWIPCMGLITGSTTPSMHISSRGVVVIGDTIGGGVWAGARVRV